MFLYADQATHICIFFPIVSKRMKNCSLFPCMVLGFLNHAHSLQLAHNHAAQQKEAQNGFLIFFFKLLFDGLIQL